MNNGFIDVFKNSLLTMSDDEVMACHNLAYEEHAVRKSRRQSTIKDTLTKGDKVYFEHSKKGRITGHVKKVKYKKAIIHTSTGNWDVPFHMLKQA
ncbi:MAG: hypothetical protein HOI21_06085 [Bacteroidetes Order II. Incertae sedis bacterium]|jgi:hypothetical protein|nr:hypothetical protein [Bacteroidetes Order II. bacterium]